MEQQGAIQSQQIMSSGTKYSGTIYTPFDNTAPSEQSAVVGSTSSRGSGPRKDKITGPDTPPSEQFPVGEPWIMLALAAAMGGLTMLRRRYTDKV